MLGYAVETRPARRKASPTTLALIVAGHAGLILAVLSSKMDLATGIRATPPEIYNVPLPKDPPPVPPEPRQPEMPPSRELPFDRVLPVVPVPDLRPADPYIPPQNPAPDIGAQPLPTPDVPKSVVRVGPKAATPEGALRPPYPEAKRRLAQEAVLRLRLSIDERGRVRSVEPLGAADPMFLASARTHLIRNWRYAPAMEGGRPVASSIVITLRFELDQV